MASTTPHVSLKNIKLHFRCKPEAHSKLCEIIEIAKEIDDSNIIKVYHNFAVVRTAYVYIIFFDALTINCTGIPCYNEIEDAVSLFSEWHGIEKSLIHSVKIDNLTCAGQYPNKVDFRTLIAKCHRLQKESRRVRFNPEYFPSCIINFKDIGGTVSFFRSGKYSIVGCSSISQAETVAERLYKILDEISHGL